MEIYVFPPSAEGIKKLLPKTEKKEKGFRNLDSASPTARELWDKSGVANAT